MPNHVRQAMTVIGDPNQVLAFVEAARGKRPPTGDTEGFNKSDEDQPESALEFHALVPLPDEYSKVPYSTSDGSPNGYDMEHQTWGTKWGAYDLDEFEHDPSSKIATYDFTCAWGPPVLFYEKISLRFPELVIVASYGGEGPCLGYMVFKNGNMLEAIEGDYNDAPDTEDEDDYEKYFEWIDTYLDSHDEKVDEYLRGLHLKVE